MDSLRALLVNIVRLNLVKLSMGIATMLEMSQEGNRMLSQETPRESFIFTSTSMALNPLSGRPGASEAIAGAVKSTGVSLYTVKLWLTCLPCRCWYCWGF